MVSVGSRVDKSANLARLSPNELTRLLRIKKPCSKPCSVCRWCEVVLGQATLRAGSCANAARPLSGARHAKAFMCWKCMS